MAMDRIGNTGMGFPWTDNRKCTLLPTCPACRNIQEINRNIGFPEQQKMYLTAHMSCLPKYPGNKQEHWISRTTGNVPYCPYVLLPKYPGNVQEHGISSNNRKCTLLPICPAAEISRKCTGTWDFLKQQEMYLTAHMSCLLKYPGNVQKIFAKNFLDISCDTPR